MSLGGGDITTHKTQLEFYLEERRLERSIDLDILAFWKANEARSPELSAMARDVLCIPLSTVSSESAFSNGGQVLDQYRSTLKPDVVEAIICTHDWIIGRGNTLIF